MSLYILFLFAVMAADLYLGVVCHKDGQYKHAHLAFALLGAMTAITALTILC